MIIARRRLQTRLAKRDESAACEERRHGDRTCVHVTSHASMIIKTKKYDNDNNTKDNSNSSTNNSTNNDNAAATTTDNHNNNNNNNNDNDNNNNDKRGVAVRALRVATRARRARSGEGKMT